jgi:ABC-2 type transport system permease protein
MTSKTSAHLASTKEHLLLGFVPFFQKELQAWKYEKRSAILVLLLVPALLGLALAGGTKFFVWKTGLSSPPDLALVAFGSNSLWVISITLLFSIGIIPKEVEQGTLAWNLTKPLSRTAFLLGKWAAYSLMIWFIGVVLVSFILWITTIVVLGWSTTGLMAILSAQIAALCAIAFWVLVCILFGLILKDQAGVMAGAMVLGLIGVLLPNLSVLSAVLPISKSAQETLKFAAQFYPSNTTDYLISASTPFKSVAYLLYMAGMAIGTKQIFDRKEYS